MLDVKEDRLRYKEILSLSDNYNYEVDKVFTTTYSLDIKALVAIYLMFGLDEEVLENKDKDIPILQSWIRLWEKVVVVCQNGAILAPKKEEKLCTFFENIIYSVKLKNKNFHPKFWLIKYKHKTEEDTKKYKIVVTSKNLTFDRSWDMEINMEGIYNSKARGKNKTIVNFLKNIKDEINQPNASNLIDELIKDLPSVEFDISLNRFPVDKCEFIEFSKKTENKIQYVTEILPEKLTESFIISPFIDNSIIKNAIKNTNKKVTLITRNSELYKIKDLIEEKLDVYVVNQRIQEGETNIEEEDFEQRKQDIHAKMFCFKDKKNTYLYIGSANATNSAFNGNTEVMFKITVPNSNINFFNFIKKEILKVDEIENKDGEKEERHYFRKVNKEEILKTENEEENIFEKFTREFFGLNAYAEVQKDIKNETYTLKVYFENFQNKFDVSVKPLLTTQNTTEKLDSSGNAIFKGLELEELSEFYIIKISDYEKMVKISTKNIPSFEERINAVASNMIKDENDFYRCLSFIINDNYLLHLLEENYLKNSNKAHIFNNTFIPGIYEKMLKTAALNREIVDKRFKEIEHLMNLTSGKSFDKNEKFKEMYNEFNELYNQFKEVVD